MSTFETLPLIGRLRVRWRSLVVPPILPTRHERPEVHAKLFDCRTAHVPPAIIDFVDSAIAIQDKSVRNGDWVVCIGRVYDLECGDHLLLFIAEEREGRSQAVLDVLREHRAVNRDYDQLAI